MKNIDRAREIVQKLKDAGVVFPEGMSIEETDFPSSSYNSLENRMGISKLPESTSNIDQTILHELGHAVNQESCLELFCQKMKMANELGVSTEDIFNSNIVDSNKVFDIWNKVGHNESIAWRDAVRLGNLIGIDITDKDLDKHYEATSDLAFTEKEEFDKIIRSETNVKINKLEPVVPLPNNAEKSVPKAIDRKKRHAEAHKNKREAIKKSVDDEILRGKPGTSAADVLTNEELSDVNKIEAEFATTPPKEDFIPPAAKNWIPPTKQPIQQEVPLATPVGDPYFKQPKIEPPGPTKLSPPVPGKNNVSSPIADSVKKAEEKLKNGAGKVSAKETAKAAAKQGENLFTKASATMKKNYGAAIVTGALIGIAALSFMWDKLKERRAVENANIASDINNNNISNYQPEYTRQGIYDDLQSNSGPGNLALQMNKNAHRGKSYAR